MGQRPREHAGTGPARLGRQEWSATWRVDRPLEVMPDALRQTQRLPARGNWRGARLGKRARLRTSADRLEDTLPIGEAGPNHVGRAHRTRPDSHRAERV